MRNRKMKTAALILASALAVVPCFGAMAAETDENTVTDSAIVQADTAAQAEPATVQADTAAQAEPATIQADTAAAQSEVTGALVGLRYDGGQLYENELIDMIRNADGDVKIQMMQSGLSIPASALNQAREQEKKLIIEIFQPGNDAAMFNSRWVYDPSTVYWTPDLESYPLGVAVDPDAPYHSSHPDAASNPISDVIRGVSGEAVEWSVYSVPTAEGEDGQAGYTIPGFYVEIAHWGEFDGMEEMPLYTYDEENGSLFRSSRYAVRGDNAVVSDSIVWHTVRINNPAWGTNYAVLSDEHNFLPVEEIEAQIADDSVPAVDVQMGACYLDNQYVAPAGMLDKLKDSGKTLSLTSPGVESQPTYSWHFDGSQITDTADVDLHIQFYYSPGEEAIEGVTMPQGFRTILLDFAHSGLVPAGTSVSLTTSEDMQSGWLYYVNQENGTFEYVGRTSWERENESFGTLTISGMTHCSYYLVTAQELTGDNVVIPEDPTDPEEPTDPSDPTTPTDPVDPSNPSDPSEPENPTDPVKPSEPTDPADPTDPSDSDNPADPENPDSTENKDDTKNPDDTKKPADEKPQTGGAVKTGDSAPLFPAAAAAAVSMAAVLVVLKKKVAR